MQRTLQAHGPATLIGPWRPLDFFDYSQQVESRSVQPHGFVNSACVAECAPTSLRYGVYWLQEADHRALVDSDRQAGAIKLVDALQALQSLASRQEASRFAKLIPCSDQ